VGTWDVAAEEQFDIAAKTSSTITNSERTSMLQSMLVDRFGLTSHREQKNMAVYYLDREGSQKRLTRSSEEERTSVRITDKGVSFRNVTLARVGEFLAGIETVNRPVIDRSGLQGRYDFDLAMSNSGTPPESSQEHAVYTWQSIFSDVKQIGFKLSPGRSAVDVLVIDRVRRPSSN